jgi:hypothetical protein
LQVSSLYCWLEIKEQDVSGIKSAKWIIDLACMADITTHLIELKLNLQGKNKFITSVYDNVKNFQTKLWVWKCQLKNGNMLHFIFTEKRHIKCCVISLSSLGIKNSQKFIFLHVLPLLHCPKSICMFCFVALLSFL